MYFKEACINIYIFFFCFHSKFITNNTNTFEMVHFCLKTNLPVDFTVRENVTQ